VKKLIKKVKEREKKCECREKRNRQPHFFCLGLAAKPKEGTTNKLAKRASVKGVFKAIKRPYRSYVFKGRLK